MISSIAFVSSPLSLFYSFDSSINEDSDLYGTLSPSPSLAVWHVIEYGREVGRSRNLNMDSRMDKSAEEMEWKQIGTSW
jgi:hypothetical protein